MKPYAYHLFSANGKWPDQIGPILLELNVAGSTVEQAIVNAKQRLAENGHSIPYDFAWLKDDDGWTVWSSVEDG